MAKVIKMKDLLKEGNAWDRKFGEKLPTLADVKKAHQTKKEMNELTTDQKHKKAQKLIQTLRSTVKELAAFGEDYSAFQNAKHSAKLLKKMKKDVLYIS